MTGSELSKNKLRTEMRHTILNTVKPVEEAGRDSSLSQGTRTLFSFVSTDRERSTGVIIDSALRADIRVALPRVLKKDLYFHEIASVSEAGTVGSFGIREPPASAPVLFPADGNSAKFLFPLVILVPGLAFTREGHRLGQGGGFYDRFLSKFVAAYPDKREMITVAGFCWGFQILDSLPVDSHDFKMDCLYTENACILCT